MVSSSSDEFSVVFSSGVDGCELGAFELEIVDNSAALSSCLMFEAILTTCLDRDSVIEPRRYGRKDSQNVI